MRMPLFRLAVVVLACLAAAPARGAGSTSCPERRAYLEESLAGASDAAGVVRQVAGPGVALLVLAENHRRRPWDLYVRVLETVKAADPALDCLFLEKYVKHQVRIDAYLSGRGPYADDERPLLDAAKRLGLSVHAVDTPPSDELPLSRSIQARNAFMSEAVAARLRESRCRKAVMPLGKGHVMTSVIDPAETDRRSLLERVRALGVKTAAVNVMHRAAWTESYGDEFGPKDCAWNLWEGLERGGPPRGFVPASPAPAVEPILDAGASRLTWTDAASWDRYDGVLVAP